MSEDQSPEQAEPTPAADDELSYESARAELVDVVRRLEAGGTSLAESLQLWERGEALAGICQRWLDGARERVEKSRADDQSGEDALTDR